MCGDVLVGSSHVERKVYMTLTKCVLHVILWRYSMVIFYEVNSVFYGGKLRIHTTHFIMPFMHPLYLSRFIYPWTSF